MGSTTLRSGRSARALKAKTPRGSSQASQAQEAKTNDDARALRAFLRRRWPLVLLAAAAAFLCLIHLDNTALWGDESEDAIIARNFLATGSLTGWDGRNLYIYGNGQALDARLRFRNPPAGALLTSASFRLFGVSTWSARFPSAILGILAVLALMKLCAEEFPGDDAAIFYAAGAMALNPTFLLNARQCRYYMTCMFMGLCAYWAHARYLKKPSVGSATALAAAATLFFYSNWMLCAGFLIGLAAVHFIFHSTALDRKGWMGLLASAGAFLACTMPYAVSLRIWDRPFLLPIVWMGWAHRRSLLLYYHVREMNMINGIPWGVLAIFLLLMARRRLGGRDEQRAALKLLACGFANLIGVALVSPQPVELIDMADIRYLIASLPFFCGFIGWALSRLSRVHRLATIAIFLALIASNVLSCVPERHWKFHWLLPAYFNEMFHPYPTSISEITNYLARHAKQDDLVYACPVGDNYPIMFYLGWKLRLCCLIALNSPLPEQPLRALGAPLYLEKNFPDWIVSCVTPKETSELVAFFSRPHEEKGGVVVYHYALADVLNVYRSDPSRPELTLHSFGPIKNFDPATDGVAIFHKTKKTTL
jgi:4-amino-4-deoxy-L-arabinose transferase-like glycosyltransferase